MLKPLEEFHKMKSASDGRKPRCKICVSAYEKGRYAADSDRIRTAEKARRDAQPEKYRARARAARDKNKPQCVERSRQYRRDKPHEAAYAAQRANAAARDIEWGFSLKQWIVWWGTDFQHRGNSGDGLCMCRFGDTGPYSAENCYPATRRENASGPRTIS